jgi:peptide/nickel transport system permease protein
MGITLFVVSILSFLIVALAPGDPYDKTLDPNSTDSDIERQRDVTGYDDPVTVKYTTYYSNFFGDLWAAADMNFFGGSEDHEWKLISYRTREPILPTMWRKMLVTLPLVILTTVIVWTLSFPVGIFSALRRGRWQDQLITVGAYALIALPGFWISLLIIQFITRQVEKPIIAPYTIGIELDGISAVMDATWHVAVPAFVGALTGMAVLSRYVKGQMMEVMGQDYVRTARTKGLEGDTVYYKHALRNASLPFITMLAGLLPALFGGSVVFEAIYSWPGLGRWVFEAVFNKDIFIVVTSLFVGSALTLFGILISDLLYSVADPRVKLS